MFLNSRQNGCWTVLVEDKDLDEVYHHLCECYTQGDAERIGKLILSDDPTAKVWIQHNYKLSKRS